MIATFLCHRKRFNFQIFLISVIFCSSDTLYYCRKMSDLSRLGLSEGKIKDTEKNVGLCTTLKNMLNEADERNVEVDKNTGTLIYNLATKLKKQEHMPVIYNLVLEKKVHILQGVSRGTQRF